MALASLIVKIGADLSDLNKALSTTDRQLQRFGRKVGNVGEAMAVGLTAPLVGLAALAIKSAADMEALMRGLTAVSGSADEAGKQFERLKEVAKLPGLGLEEAIQGSINLQAAGFSAIQAEASLKAFGNALATVGKGKDDLQGVILALGQMASKGKVSAEEINQIAERVPQIRQVMVEAFGTAIPAEIEKSGITAQEFVARVTTELAKLPPVAGGAKNSFENLGDTMKQLAAIWGNLLLPIVVKATNAISAFAGWMGQLSPQVQQSILVIGGLVAAIGPLLVVTGMILTHLPMLKLAFVALTGPIGLTVAAITALTAAWLIWGDDIKRISAAVYAAVQTWIGDKITAVLNAVSVPINAVVGFFSAAKTAVEGLVSAMVSGIHTHLIGRFTAIVETVRQKVAAITGFFRDMCDKVVGHSYVPDMIAAIGGEFAKLDGVMVQPALATTARVGNLFEEMATRNVAALRAQSEEVALAREQFLALGGSLEQVAVSSATMANGFSGSLGVIGNAVSAITGGKSTSIMDALSGFLGAGKGSGGAGGILGGILKGVGGNLLGPGGMAMLAGGPAGIAIGLGTKLLTPLVGKAVGAVKDKVGGFIGGLFGKKKKKTAPTVAAVAQTYTPPTFTGSAYSAGGSVGSSGEEVALLRAQLDELRASVRVAQEAERRQAERDASTQSALLDMRREFRLLQAAA